MRRFQTKRGHAVAPTALKLKLSLKAKLALRKARKVTVTLAVTANDASGNARTVTRRLTLRR